MIIGGGASGSITAWHLARLRMAGAGERIVVIEPRAALGAGQAYGTLDASHRINVPASRMTIHAAQPDDFSTWLAEQVLNDADARRPNGDVYPARAQFALYLAARLKPYQDAGTIVHCRASVERLRREELTWVAELADGRGEVRAARVVLATSHPPPQLLPQLVSVKDHARIIANPWAESALAAIAPYDSVAIIGTGLTMADCVASLSAQGHLGSVLAFSRRGMRSGGHAEGLARGAWGENFTNNLPRTALALLQRVRGSVEESGRQGLPWQAVFDALKMQGRSLWQALPLDEKRRFVRHLRVFWDIHRFRIAPQLESVLEAGIKRGQVCIEAARLQGVEAEYEEIILHMRRRGMGVETRSVQWLINAVGPNHAGILRTKSYLARLSEDGWVEADPVGLGLHTRQDHRAVGVRGVSDTLFIAGPLSRATFGELMGFPEITTYAESVALAVLKS
ncbi:FAD/NAD(P)-binding protein [Neokomagataea anthophila]|uniref:FAD/NAD(P)-binding protein n=1 Tax=Neokomagataea anthophila TaxID=2826925 RepID=A0ABS5E940_9PROT|nr:FAD/NAD(P)-binding protein [Neokomagataea anthophila]MBR0560425.1 FAD/NAD(P)-binding protein [Neokomagataea anthophila]